MQCRGQKCEGGLGEHLVALFHPYKLVIPKDSFSPSYFSHHSVLASVCENLVKVFFFSLADNLYGSHPILDTRISVLWTLDFITLVIPPLKSETGWTGELLNWQN